MKHKSRMPPHEGPGKSTGDGDKPLTQAEATAAMDKFKSVTKSLLSVSNASLQAELRRQETTKARRLKRRRNPG